MNSARSRAGRVAERIKVQEKKPRELKLYGFFRNKLETDVYGLAKKFKFNSSLLTE